MSKSDLQDLLTMVHQHVIWRRDVRWKPTPGRGPTLARIAHERWAPGFDFCGSGHPATVLVVRTGSGLLMADGRTWRLTAGWLGAFVAGIPYRYSVDRRQPLELVLLRLHGAGADAGLRRIGGSDAFAHDCSNDPRLQRLADLLVDIGCSAGLDAQAICDQLLPALFAVMATAVPARPATAGERRWQRAKAWIDTHALDGVTVTGAARAAGVGRAHLSRLCRRYAGTTPLHYLLDLRLRIAADLLLEPGADIPTVADQLGFSDRYTFAKAFRRVLGAPPGAYLKRARTAGPYVAGDKAADG